MRIAAPARSLAVPTVIALASISLHSPAHAGTPPSTSRPSLAAPTQGCSADESAAALVRGSEARRAKAVAIRASLSPDNRRHSRGLDLRAGRVVQADGGLIYSASRVTETGGRTIAVSLDEDLRATQVTATRLERTADGDRVRVRTWIDGEPAPSRTLSLDGAASSNRGVVAWTRALNRCLSSAGISAWVVAAAMVACGIASPAAVVLCLIGVGVGAGTASYCVQYAFRNDRPVAGRASREG